jgi:hypothetical protein
LSNQQIPLLLVFETTHKSANISESIINDSAIFQGLLNFTFKKNFT